MRIFQFLLFFFFGTLAFSSVAYAAELQGAVYADVQTSELGEVRIYFPVAYQSGYLTTDDSGAIYNASNTSLTGYILDDNNERYYTVTLAAWSYPYYRLTSSGNYGTNTAALTISNVLESNIDFLNYDTILLSPGEVSFLLIIFLLGVLVILWFMRH